ncbi:L-histidine N(alpha)-methyltransferase [Calothrix sp. PCC 6303]|uniref:L-histidine N(alpha)-methyltransferase n=1 Tax=Calothrix sp. PCC 6303 TaxID=1170562 RepID=UPI0002A0330E|nr:L-histidine N(alpha)-methyltransferase [Calothrix sp. PCC 6303]AFZ02550.1 methyltransferase [Calothrix sp. PCC 6303]
MGKNQVDLQNNINNKRLQIQRLHKPTTLVTTVGIDVIKGLTQVQKSLPPKYFYDDKGSQLFEKICELPEYYVTRTETAIFQSCASEIANLTGECELIELGSGSSTKTRILLDAYKVNNFSLRYLPIDVSGGILESSANKLLIDYPNLDVHALVGTYESALLELPEKKLFNRMLAFIGSTLGNLTIEECDIFLSQITDALHKGEYFLLGIDLQKPKEILEAAYNDSQGVTAAFNLNILEHLNYLFDGDFNLSEFEHFAFFNEKQSQIEMHLRSLKRQVVNLKKLNITVHFEQNETILTEISRKFNLDEIQNQLRLHDLAPQKIWTDKNEWFGLILCQY